MKKYFYFLLGLFIGCDNNRGPFEYKYKDGDLILFSNNKPAKGLVEKEYNSKELVFK